jgi:outer membrane protein OmpA-like peptidoglycan-associated protein
MLLLTILTAAMAQDTRDVAMPDLNAQAFRPSIDSAATLWTDDALLADPGHATLRLAGNWAHNPLVVRWADDSTTALVKDAVNLDLLAGVTIWRIRAGVDLPLYLLSTSDVEAGGAGLGDLALDLRGGILSEDEGAPIGLALGGRMTLPTATMNTALGTPGMGGEIGLIASKQLTDELLVAGNLGTRFVPETQLVNVEVDDQFFYRLGGGYALTDDAGVSLDVAGHLNYNQPFGNSAANPIEGLLGGWYRVADALLLRGGVGHGFTRGISSPDFRLVAMLSWEPRQDPDTDLDGLADSVDACPEQPEDVDRWEDDDGCPDPSSVVTIRVVDGEGQPVKGASSKVSGPEPFEGGAEHSGTVHPGSYQVRASAEGWLPDAASFDVEAGADQEVTLVLAQAKGLVQVRVTGPDGQPIDASFTVGDSDPAATEGGEGELAVAPGATGVTVRAEGYAVANQKVEIVASETTIVEFELRPTQVELTVEKIEIKGEVYFDTAKATIKPESFPLLDEVTQVMVDHPEVLRLRVEGHTDSRGDDSYNLQLSKDRAASVMAYLTDKGVAAERLESEGFGESKPLIRGENTAAWEKNRRVDFFVAEWDEAERTRTVE